MYEMAVLNICSYTGEKWQVGTFFSDPPLPHQVVKDSIPFLQQYINLLHVGALLDTAADE
jgi:hypothetical protein